MHRAAIYMRRKNFGPKAFSLGGKQYNYEVHPFILDNERAVEIGLARTFLNEHSGRILEVGNVLGNFTPHVHDVVDKYEVAPGVINEDIITFEPPKKYDAIVTLSTLEHVGWDETPRTPEKILAAIAHLKTLLTPGGELMATMPPGYNAFLDQIVREQRTGFSKVKFLVRTTANNQWCEAALEEAMSRKFNEPFTCANALIVGTFTAPKK
jgi:hypothetical protein